MKIKIVRLKGTAGLHLPARKNLVLVRGPGRGRALTPGAGRGATGARTADRALAPTGVRDRARVADLVLVAGTPDRGLARMAGGTQGHPCLTGEGTSETE